MLGENNTLYYTKSLLCNGLYSIMHFLPFHYFLKIKNKSISIVCEMGYSNYYRHPPLLRNLGISRGEVH
jgi:hypothetical protein